MIGRLSFVALVSLLTPLVWAAPLHVDVTGANNDKAPLETLSASPDLPRPDSLSYSLDGGKALRDSEIVPLSVSEAAMLSERSRRPTPGVPFIPSAPYILHPIPTEMLRVSTWTFVVTDDEAHVWHEQALQSTATASFAWDGRRDGRFVLDPNITYLSLLKGTHPDGTITTFVGQAARFPAFLRHDNDNLVVVLGERVYGKDLGSFSEMATITLDDLVRRLAQLPPPLPNDWTDNPTWSITLFEPSGNEAVGIARMNQWKNYLESKLGLKIPPNRFTVREAADHHSHVEVVLKGASLLPLDEAMHAPSARSRPVSDSVADGVRIQTNKDLVVVEFRHDRLFRSSTAYLRDETLPLLLDAMKQVRAELPASSPPSKRRVVLRHRSEYPEAKKTDRQTEESRLTALRSDALFSLFAKAGLLN